MNNNVIVQFSKIEEKITPKTKAILVVHLYGQASDMTAVVELCRKYDLRLVEDCAQAHGAEWNGKQIGTFVHAPTVTPMLSYSTTSSGDIIAAYYPDNTLVDIVTDVECELIVNDGMIMTKGGVHVAVGTVIKIHTETVDLDVEIVAVEKNASN